MHDDELNEILRVVDAPTAAPEAFRSTLLRDLRDAYEGSVATGPTMDPELPSATELDLAPMLEGETQAEIIPLSLAPAESQRSWVRRGLLVAAAAAAVVLGLLLAPSDDSTIVEFVDEPAPAIVTTTTAAPLPPADACIELAVVTRPFSDLADQAAAEPLSVVADLEVWLRAVDQLLERSLSFLSPDEEASILRTRVLLRQAIDSPSSNTVLAVERHWRDVTSQDPLTACRQ